MKPSLPLTLTTIMVLSTFQLSYAQDDAQASQAPQGRLGGGAFRNLSPEQKQALLKRIMQKRAERQKNETSQRPAVNSNNVVFKSDIPYGSAPLQRLDVYSPQAPKEALPIVIFVHGGGWHRGDKAQGDRKDKGTTYVNNGIVFISINYRLAPQVMHPCQAQDVVSAIAWVREHASELGGDPRRIYLMGHSAGAHLVDLVGTNDRFLSEKGLGLKDISGVISLDTASLNLSERRNDTTPEIGLVGPMIDNAFGKDAKVLRDASPTLSIQKGKSYPPFLMFCGAKRLGCIKQHEEFAAAMKKAGGRVTVKAVPLGHGDINRASGQEESEIFKDCMVMIKG